MFDGLPWPAITAAAGGWTLAGLVVVAVLWALFNGRLVTRREADLSEKRAEKAEARAEKAEALNGEVIKQNGTLMESSEITNTVMRALRDQIDGRAEAGP